ncbi:hypothetical protein J2Y58_002932 [Sphingomonas sp. BE138]|uniref:hypothetical protein n=1 Tax=Sphingomonas sp. BE138 TaxID=2817845 RepID=UPI00285C603E|nr:hypothetical protein [Sphingomonas sp. BE138]MDR6789559.1 hypothetical protein [Sphingomonas sp. BE138]
MITNDGHRAGRRWCILQTTAAKTLPLMAALRGEGIDAWTPSRTVKRDAPGNRRRLALGQRKVMVEVTVPILPCWVFAPERDMDDLWRLADQPEGRHPRFSVFTGARGAALVRDTAVAGLRQAEADALAAITAERAAETRAAAQRARAERLGTLRARRAALRRETKALAGGQEVTVDGMPALDGLVGKVVEGRGTSAVIHFGGALTMTIEAWRVRPNPVRTEAALTGTAA